MILGIALEFPFRPSMAARTSVRSTSAMLYVVEEGLRAPYPFAPDLVEENALLPGIINSVAKDGGAESEVPEFPEGGAEESLDATESESKSSNAEIRNPPEDHPQLERARHKAQEASLPLNDIPYVRLAIDQLTTQEEASGESSDGSSQTSIAGSAGSPQARSEDVNQVGRAALGNWIHQYPTIGVPDIDDALDDMDDLLDIGEPDFAEPNDSGYRSLSKSEPVVRETQRHYIMEQNVPRFDLTDVALLPPSTASSMAGDIRESKHNNTSTMASECSSICDESGETREEESAYGNVPIPGRPMFATGWCDRGFHVDFPRNESEPLQQGRFLGQGLNGPVYETRCKGVALAWKRKYRRSGFGPRERKEIDIMKKLSHTHIVQLAGSYTLGKFFGLLIWPVAVCDLATLLEDLNVVKKHLTLGISTAIEDPEVLERLTALGLPTDGLQELRTAITRRLSRSLGCLAGAVAYFHGEGIKHKDMKPSNILLSRGGGLWVTDFESSTDFSYLASSVTEEGERGTPKYFAPEVAARELCGRPADIFALGCIFLEMMWMYVETNTLEDLKELRPKEDSLFNFSYQANLDQKDAWFSRLPVAAVLDRHLALEVRQMLALEPEIRPTASELKTFLTAIEALNIASTEPLLHANCCIPRSLSSEGKKPLPEQQSQSDANPSAASSEPPAAATDVVLGFERWEALPPHWEGLTSYWIRRLDLNSEVLQRDHLVEQMLRQMTDLTAAGANLFHAVVELQRLRASSERKFQRWFIETRQELKENLGERGRLVAALKAEKARRKVAEANAASAEAAWREAEGKVAEKKDSEKKDAGKKDSDRKETG